MWTIIKFDKKKIFLLQKDLNKKLGEKCTLYRPQVLIDNLKKKKLVSQEFDLLGDYLFCYNSNFSNKITLDQIKFSRGFKYYLNGYIEFQREISEFINKCKKLENKDGYISDIIFELNNNNNYKFASGPFTDKIFKIIRLQKNKLDILMGNLKTTVEKRKYLFSPV